MTNHNEKFYLVDTNVWISNLDELQQFDNLVVTGAVLRELDKLKSSSNTELAFNSRKATRYIKENKDKFKFDLMDYDAESILGSSYDNGYADNRIVAQASVNEYGIISNDINVQFKAIGLGLDVIDVTTDIKDDFVDNKGFQVIDVDEETHIENLISLHNFNMYKLMINEYAIINNEVDGELLDIVKWTGEETVSLKENNGKLGKTITSSHFGSISPKDEFQTMAIDSILNHQVTVLRGSAGSGKSLLALNTAWQLVEQEGYKLMIFIQASPVANSNELGFFKGSKLEKILQSFPTLESKFGDEFVIQEFIEEGKLELHSFSHLRGLDTGENKVCVWIPESQNLTKELMRLAGQRVGTNTKLILDGDYTTQIDATIFEKDNGMKRLSEVLRGNHLFGEIELQNVWRSELAELLQEM